MYKMRTCPLQDLVEERVFIIDMRERTAIGIWKTPEQGEQVVE